MKAPAAGETVLALPDKQALSGKKESHRRRVDRRVWEIDLLRGIIIWGMIFDHCLGDFFFLFPHIFVYESYMSVPWLYQAYCRTLFWWNHPLRRAIRLFGIMLLIFLSGVSSRFSKKNKRRGFMILALGVFFALFFRLRSLLIQTQEICLLPTVATIGISVLLYALAKDLYVWASRRLMKAQQRARIRRGVLTSEALKEEPAKDPARNWKWWSLGLFVLLTGVSVFIACRYTLDASELFLSDQDRYQKPLEMYPLLKGWLIYAREPSFLETTPFYGHGDWLRIIIGTKREALFSDWLPLFPAVSFVFLGGFVGETFYASKRSLSRFFLLTGRRDPSFVQEGDRLNRRLNHLTWPINVIGRYTLWVYVFHQVVILLVFVPIILAFGVPLAL